MENKIKVKQHSYTVEFLSLAIVSIIYNCLMIVSLCYIAFIKDWWAALLLIPCCTLLPSFKIDNKEDKDGE